MALLAAALMCWVAVVPHAAVSAVRVLGSTAEAAGSQAQGLKIPVGGAVMDIPRVFMDKVGDTLHLTLFNDTLEVSQSMTDSFMKKKKRKTKHYKEQH